MYDPLNVVENAQSQSDSCADCPAAHPDDNGKIRAENVHPGYFNYKDSDIIFVGSETNHSTASDWYESMEKYNRESGSGFLKNGKGGFDLARVLEQVPGVELTDTWVTDTTKCGLKENEDGHSGAEEWHRCQQYLAEEFDNIDPAVVVALGAKPRTRLLDLLGQSELEDSLNTVAYDVGRILPTDPPIVSAVHWSQRNPYNLTATPISGWGGDDNWPADAEYLSQSSYWSNMVILQEAVAAAHADAT